EALLGATLRLKLGHPRILARSARNGRLQAEKPPTGSRRRAAWGRVIGAILRHRNGRGAPQQIVAPAVWGATQSLAAQRGASTITIWRPSMRGSDSTLAIGSVSVLTRCSTCQPSS